MPKESFYPLSRLNDAREAPLVRKCETEPRANARGSESAVLGHAVWIGLEDPGWESCLRVSLMSRPHHDQVEAAECSLATRLM